MLDLPEIEVLEKNLKPVEIAVIERFWSSLWNNYVRNKGSTSLVYWCEQLGDSLQFNKALIILSDWINTVVVPERNWAEVSLNEEKLLEYFEKDELDEYRRNNKYYKYLPEDVYADKPFLVRVNGKVRLSGLVREGFMKACNTQYYYDSSTLSQHKEGVTRNTVKGMTNMRQNFPDIPVDSASYDVIAEEIVEKLADEPILMTQGRSYIDSRGRAIKESLSKIANPIGFKDFRSLIVIPE